MRISPQLSRGRTDFDGADTVERAQGLGEPIEWYAGVALAWTRLGVRRRKWQHERGGVSIEHD